MNRRIAATSKGNLGTQRQAWSRLGKERFTTSGPRVVFVRVKGDGAIEMEPR